jgi:hypothetical protein
MMRILSAAILALSAVAQLPAAIVTGNWTMEKALSADLLRLTVMRADTIVDAQRMVLLTATELQSFAGLTTDSVGQPIRFELVREAGTIHFDGVSRNGRAEGKFTFTENPAFVTALKGTATNWWDSGGVFELALRGVPIQALTNFGSTNLPSIRLADIGRAYTAGSTPSYPKALKETGYKLLPADIARLEALRVSPDLLRQMKVSGHDTLNTTDMLRLETHGVTSQDVRYFETRTGKSNLSVDEIVKLKINGVQ